MIQSVHIQRKFSHYLNRLTNSVGNAGESNEVNKATNSVAVADY